MLIPKKLGVEATPKNLNDLKLKKAHEEKVAAENLADAKALAAKIEAGSVSIGIKVGEGGRLFGSISTKEIAAAVKEQMNLEVDKKKLLLDSNIKELGTTEVGVKLHPQVTAKLKVNVVEA